MAQNWKPGRMPGLEELMGEPRRRMSAGEIMGAFKAAVARAGGKIIEKGGKGGEG